MTREGEGMTPATFRSILEAIGYTDDGDAARALGKSRSILQKWKAGERPVPGDVAQVVRDLQDAFADAREAALDAAPGMLWVWKGGQAGNEASWAATGRPSRWHRLIAAECYQEHGTIIHYIDDLPDHDPMGYLESLGNGS